MSIYSANLRYIACKLLKLEAPENINIMGVFLGAYPVHIIGHYIHNLHVNA